MEPNKNLLPLSNESADVIGLTFTSRVSSFSSLLAKQQRMKSEIAKNRMHFFKGPLGDVNPLEPYTFPLEGQYRIWELADSQLSCVELNLHGRRSIALLNKEKDEAIIFQPKVLVAHDEHAASGRNGVMRFNIQEFKRAVNRVDKELFANALMGVIHEACHIEDAVNQPVELLRLELTQICMKVLSFQDSLALSHFVEIGIVNADELNNSILAIQSTEGGASLRPDSKPGDSDLTSSENLRNLTIEVMIERRNHFVTQAFIIQMFGSLESFDSLIGVAPGITSSNCDYALDSRRQVASRLTPTLPPTIPDKPLDFQPKTTVRFTGI